MPEGSPLQLIENKKRRVWKCSICSKVDVWGMTWSYYGPKYDPFPNEEDIKAVFCSVECARQYVPPTPKEKK